MVLQPDASVEQKYLYCSLENHVCTGASKNLTTLYSNR